MSTITQDPILRAPFEKGVKLCYYSMLGNPNWVSLAQAQTGAYQTSQGVYDPTPVCNAIAAYAIIAYTSIYNALLNTTTVVP
jgi:hypothetical protein